MTDYIYPTTTRMGVRWNHQLGEDGNWVIMAEGFPNNPVAFVDGLALACNIVDAHNRELDHA